MGFSCAGRDPLTGAAGPQARRSTPAAAGRSRNRGRPPRTKIGGTMRSYLHEGMLLYLDKLVDWDAYFRGTKGEGVDVQAEVGALRSILETVAEICAEHEPLAREHWDEEARLENGEVVLPRHIQDAYDKLREAGLTT